MFMNLMELMFDTAILFKPKLIWRWETGSDKKGFKPTTSWPKELGFKSITDTLPD
jgi:hypothetical protein